jgi:acyl-CoA synthetase (NDP forming)/GNAT superfamily N-acetyltransferase
MSEPVSVYALLADGRTVEIRPATPADFDAVKAMHEAMSSDNAYLRFFSLSRVAGEQEARRVTRAPGADHAALLAVYDGDVVGLASYEVEPPANVNRGETTAEVAFAVADTMHHRGIATLLLEHLVSLARAQFLTALTAETLTENTSMLRVFSDAGLPVTVRRADGVAHITIPLPPDDASKQHADYLDTVAVREQSANVASLRPLLHPRSVVVVGASRRSETVGRAVLENITRGGFAGRVYAVNPNVAEIGGVPSFRDVASLPEAPELALLAVPPDAVLAAAEDCGASGVRGLVVFTTGLGAPASAALLAICRRYGMRLIGPNCFGVAVPGIGLDATFGAATPLPGDVGLVMQSGGLGFALVDHLSRLGIGISSFASVGNKLDVSSNDLLMWWGQDGVTKLAVLYIESFGNPRKFARTARQVGARMPVLTVLAGRTEAGQRAAARHTDASPTPLVTREALFDQAGIIVTPGFRELIDTTALLATQPPPAGRTVAIVSNVGGAGVLAADACTDFGLTVHRPGDQLRERLAAFIPDGGAVTGPVDTTASATRADFRQVLELIAADETVDAVIALVLPTGPARDIGSAICEAAVPVPVAAVVLNQPEAIGMLEASVASGTRKVPSYGSPEAAVGAVARAGRYARWRGTPPGPVPRFADVNVAGARAMLRDFLFANTDGGWLAQQDAASLLRYYGIELTAEPGAGGVAVAIGVNDDPMFGPLVTFGGGSAGLAGTGVAGTGAGSAGAGSAGAEQSARFTPLTQEDADALLGPLRFAASTTSAADRAALRTLLLRVSQLSDDLPEVAQLDLDPVLAQPAGIVVAGAGVRVAPPVPQDPFLRRLR